MTRAFAPRGLEEALALLADPELGAIPLAGGTDVMVAVHAGVLAPAAVVDVTRLAELRALGEEGDGLVIGAAVTFSELGRHPLVRAQAPMLADAARQVGAWQIQNRATLGGNLGTASPAGDALPVLLALDAELEVASTRGRRRIASAILHTGYRRLALEPGELIVAVHLPPSPRGHLQLFRKVGTRAAQAVSKVSLAFAARRDGGRLRAVRLAAGSVAPVPLRLTDAEAACEGTRLTRALVAKAAALAEAAVQPIDDVRSTADYRRFVVGRLVSRVLSDAVDHA